MPDSQVDIIKKGVDEVINEDGLIKKLKSSEPLIIKAGFDPTAPDLHLGHTVLLNKLRQFNRFAGYKLNFLVIKLRYRQQLVIFPYGRKIRGNIFKRK